MTADMLLITGQRKSAMPLEATSSSPEAMLVRAVPEGNRDSFGRLYELYAPMVHGILLARVPRTEVDDLVQDIFLHAFKKLGALRDPNRLWLACRSRAIGLRIYRYKHATVEEGRTRNC